MSDHERFIAIAIDEARIGLSQGEQPFGACVVRDGTIVSRTHSVKVQSFDVTAHAEVRAIGLATRALKSRNLRGCTFYSVCEPCPMCCGAILGAEVTSLVLGVRLANLRAIYRKQSGRDFDESVPFDLDRYSAASLAALVGSEMRIVTGVLEQECEDLYQNSAVTVTF